jgi:ubiquinone/menaquinone biosynthesis C-methylase UbiE
MNSYKINPEEINEEERIQKELYDRIAVEYELHYSDKYSQKYRTKFYNDPMIGEINLKNLKVLEAMSGSGQTTDYLLAKGAKVTALDISPQVIASFQKKFPDCEAIVGSILNTGFPDEIFDCVVIVGGLHHLHPHVDRVIDEVYRVLKPGGYFCFVEPHTGSLPDIARKLWYKLDKNLFERNEKAVDLQDLKSKNMDRFDFISDKYFGNLAYLFVMNSLIFRIPLGFKRYYSDILINLEGFISHFQTKALSCFMACQWRKKI